MRQNVSNYKSIGMVKEIQIIYVMYRKGKKMKDKHRNVHFK